MNRDEQSLQFRAGEKAKSAGMFLFLICSAVEVMLIRASVAADTLL